MIAEKLQKKFGHNFIVENVTGGSTIIASNKVAKAAPDGCTLLLHNLQISAKLRHHRTPYVAIVRAEDRAQIRRDCLSRRRPAVTDVLGDHVDFLIGTPQQMMPRVKAGKLKAYAVTQKGKMPEFPNADSMADVLGPQFAIYYWQGLFAPSKTPDAVIKTLNAAVNDVANDPEVLKQWHDTGVEAFAKDMRSPAAGEKFLKSEIARWAK